MITIIVHNVLMLLYVAYLFVSLFSLLHYLLTLQWPAVTSCIVAFLMPPPPTLALHADTERALTVQENLLKHLLRDDRVGE